MMTDARIMSIDELQAFLASNYVVTFKGSSRGESHARIERTLRIYCSLSRPRREKGLLRRSYLVGREGIQDRTVGGRLRILG